MAKFCKIHGKNTTISVNCYYVVMSKFRFIPPQFATVFFSRSMCCWLRDV